jgi:hypothetical protein
MLLVLRLGRFFTISCMLSTGGRIWVWVLFTIEVMPPSTLLLLAFYRFQAEHTSWLGVPSTKATRGLLPIILHEEPPPLLELNDFISKRGEGNLMMLIFSESLATCPRDRGGLLGPTRKRVLVELYLGRVTVLYEFAMLKSGDEVFIMITYGADISADLYPDVFVVIAICGTSSLSKLD